MEPTTIELIKTVTTDAIKILGPAIIAAFATYQVSKAQFELKLRELEKSHEFGARDKLFNYYKERKKELEKSFNDLNGTFGQTLGLTIGSDGTMDEFTKKIFEGSSEMVKMYSKFVPHEIDKAIHEMEKRNLIDSKEYKKLKEFNDEDFTIEEINDFQSLQKNIFMLLEIYYYLHSSIQLILEIEMEKAFEKYIKA